MKPPKHPSEVSESTRKWWKCPGVVYFVAAGDPPIAVKIGMAAQTEKQSLRSTIVRRISQIQTSNHEPVKLLGVVSFTEGDYPTRDAETFERELHLEFAHLQRFKKYSRGSEWFTATPELMKKIFAVATPAFELGLPETFSEVENVQRRTKKP